MKLLRKFHDFAPWDAQGIAAHLEEMEANGWLFRGTDVLDHWEYMEQLLQYIRSFGFENLTTMEFVNRCYPQNYRR